MLPTKGDSREKDRVIALIDNDGCVYIRVQQFGIGERLDE